MTASRFELPRSCIALAGLAILPAVGCFRMRAPPPMAPHATGRVIQSQQSGGQLLGSAGASSDVLSSSSSDASLDGRLELGKHFDLGLGGAYGAGGLPNGT